MAKVGGMGVKWKPEPGNEAPAVNEDEVPVVLKLSLPQSLYKEYETAAEKQGLTVTELVMHRLQRCKDHNALRPIYFADTQRQQLENLLQKRPLGDADQALTLLTSCLTVKVGDFPPVPITAQQNKRLAMAGYAGQTAEQRVTQLIQAAVAKATGI